MKSKHSFSYLLLAMSFLVQPLFADDNQKKLAKFVISDAKIDGVDHSPVYLAAGAYIVFYSNKKEDQTFMANYWPAQDSQSYGQIYSLEHEEFAETTDHYEWEVFTFNWSYKNTYDNKTGTAKVHFSKIYKPQGVAFVIKIVTESLQILEFKGFMHGTVDFNVSCLVSRSRCVAQIRKCVATCDLIRYPTEIMASKL